MTLCSFIISLVVDVQNDALELHKFQFGAQGSQVEANLGWPLKVLILLRTKTCNVDIWTIDLIVFLTPGLWKWIQFRNGLHFCINYQIHLATYYIFKTSKYFFFSKWQNTVCLAYLTKHLENSPHFIDSRYFKEVPAISS